MKRALTALALCAALPASALDMNEARFASVATSALAQIVQIPTVGGGVAVGDNSAFTGNNSFSGTSLFSGVVTFGSAAVAANSITSASNAWLFEGATADNFETTITVTDPDVDSTFTIGYSPDGNPWIGATAGDSATSAETDNVLIGSAAGTALTGTATDNVFLGDNAGVASTTGDNNVLVGADAAVIDVGSSNAVVVGSGAKAEDNSVSIGSQAGASLVTGADFNTLVGYQAGDALAANTADHNTLVGYASGTDLTGANATLMGSGAGDTLSSGNNWTCIGKNACTAASVANDGTAFGALAGDTSTGDGGVFIGYGTDVSTAADTFATAVGYAAIVHEAAGTAIGNQAEAADGVTVGSLAGVALTSDDVDNTFVGVGAGDAAGAAVTATDNSCLGDTCMTALTSGDQNTALGADTAATLTTGGDNVVIGFGADVIDAAGANAVVVGSGAKAEDNSVSIEYQAGAGMLTGGDFNTLIGYRAGLALGNAATDYNTIVGYQAGSVTTHSNYMTIVGALAGDSGTAGNAAGNSLFGYAAGTTLTTGGNNVFLGQEADGSALIDGGVGVGFQAKVWTNLGIAIGYQAEAGDGVSIGYAAGDAQAAADVDNVWIGYQAGTAANGTSTDNTAIGDASGDTITTGDRNTLLGANTDVGTNTDSDVTVVGESMVGKASDSILIGFGGQEYMYVHGAGKVITDNTATAILDISVADDTAGGATIEYTVTAVEADEYQAERGAAYIAFENDSGTESCAIGEIGTSVLAGGGTMAVTNACTVGLTDEVRWTFTADSSLGAPATTVTLYYSIRIDGPATAVTPQ